MNVVSPDPGPGSIRVNRISPPVRSAWNRWWSWFP